MNAASPSISVILPVYNGAQYLTEALVSVQAQTLPPDEIIVVNDGSTDNSAAIAQSFANVRYHYQANAGPAAARNTGLSLARGELLAFLDADDLWPAAKLAVQSAALAAAPELAVVLGQVQFMQLEASHQFAAMAGPRLGFNLGCALFRASAFERLGTFNAALRYSEDVEWFMRAREQSLPMRVLEEVTLLYRLHGENMVRDKTARDHGFLRELKRSLERRRQSSGGPAQTLARLRQEQA